MPVTVVSMIFTIEKEKIIVTSPMIAQVRCFLPWPSFSVSAPLIVIVKADWAMENTAIGAAKYRRAPAIVWRTTIVIPVEAYFPEAL